jgi:hypothetical protein
VLSTGTAAANTKSGAKVTVPPVTGAPEDVIVAVNVTVSPSSDEAGDDVSSSTVAAWSMACSTNVAELGARVVVPLYSATNS